MRINIVYKSPWVNDHIESISNKITNSSVEVAFDMVVNAVETEKKTYALDLSCASEDSVINSNSSEPIDPIRKSIIDQINEVDIYKSIVSTSNIQMNLKTSRIHISVHVLTPLPSSISIDGFHQFLNIILQTYIQVLIDNRELVLHDYTVD